MHHDDGRPAPWTSEESPEGARPAATLILVRDSVGGAGPPELLMLRRAPTMAFAPGAIVFPGGSVDDGDHELAAMAAHDLTPQDAAGRIAAIRETIEEAGVAVGLSPVPTEAAVRSIRSGLAQGEAFGDLLRMRGLTLELDQLVPFARWCPQPRVERVTRRFDARFYVARMPDGAEASVDATENDDLRWASAAGFLAACEAGTDIAVFPTQRNLERLAQWPDHAAIVADAGAFPCELVTNWVADRDGVAHLCIPDHLGYPITEGPVTAFRRG